MSTRASHTHTHQLLLFFVQQLPPPPPPSTVQRNKYTPPDSQSPLCSSAALARLRCAAPSSTTPKKHIQKHKGAQNDNRKHWRLLNILFIIDSSVYIYFVWIQSQITIFATLSSATPTNPMLGFGWTKMRRFTLFGRVERAVLIDCFFLYALCRKHPANTAIEFCAVYGAFGGSEHASLGTES